MHSTSQDLWEDLVKHGLGNKDFLSNLLDYIGVCSINPVQFLTKIPENMPIPKLGQKILKIFIHHNFQAFLNDKSNNILERDTLALLSKLNQGQRRAIKVEPNNLRCCVCSRPLFMFPG